jgi:hypothetical protein
MFVGFHYISMAHHQPDASASTHSNHTAPNDDSSYRDSSPNNYSDLDSDGHPRGYGIPYGGRDYYGDQHSHHTYRHHHSHSDAHMRD